jgi:hypothetical protein
MTDPVARYIGNWRLIPELCLYESGEIPRSGTYLIRGREGVIDVNIAWTDASGDDLQASYGGPADGSRQAIEAPGLTHHSLVHIDDGTLDSFAYDGDEVVMWARRRASTDGSLLSVVMMIRAALGEAARNFQVYRRSDPA